MNCFKFSKPLSLYSIPLLANNLHFPENFTKCVIADTLLLRSTRNIGFVSKVLANFHGNLMSQIMSDTSNKFCHSKLPLAMSNLFSLGYE